MKRNNSFSIAKSLCYYLTFLFWLSFFGNVKAQTFFFEDFSSNNAGWILGTEWQIGPTVGTSYDPPQDYTPTSDNGVAGAVIGGNVTTNPHDYYYLTSPEIDLSGINTCLILSFQRWLNSDYHPYMQNQVQVYNGTNWITIWESGGVTGIRDNSWILQEFNIAPYANANFRVRFGHKVGGGAFNESGWNLDDVTIYSAVPSSAPTLTSVIPTTCGGSNGSITLAGFAANKIYSVGYKKNTTDVSPANITSDANGNITIPNLEAGDYTAIVASYGACASSAVSTILSDPVKPSLGTVPDICAGALSFTIPYSSFNGSPNKYSISGTGITTIIDGDLTNSITVSLSSGASVGSIPFVLTLKNTTTNCVSDNISGSVTVNPVSVGGSVSGSSMVCSGVNSTTLTLSGQVGTIQKWQSSLTSDFSNLVDISNTTTELTMNNLTQTTYYRAVVQSGVCPQAISTVATVTVNPVSVGGSVSGSSTVCLGVNSTTLTLLGQVGTIQKWQSSLTSDFSNSVDISNTTTGLTVSNLTQTTYYRVVVQSGVCAQAISTIASVQIHRKPTITLSTLQQTLTEGNNPVLCDTDANPVNSLQFNVSGLCVSGNPVWRTQVGNGAWSDWSTTAPVSQLSNNQLHRYQAACDANCASTYSGVIELTINNRATVPQNVSLSVDGVTVSVGEGKEVCSLVTIPLTFNANCAAGEVTLYSVDGGEYSSGVPTGLVDNQYHNYRVRCRKSDGTPSCVESESGVMRLKLVTIPTAPTVSLSSTSSCDATASFSGQASCGSFRTVWYNATTNVALPNLPSVVPSQTTSYYARCQTENGCVSERSNVVTFTLTPTQVAPIITASQEIVCTGTSVTVSANCPSGSQTFWNTGVTTPSFEVSFNNVTKQTYWAKCIFGGGCQSAESVRKDIYWNAFVVTLINVGESKSSVKVNDRAAWTSQFITRDGGPELEQSTQQNPTLYFVENANKVAPRYWTINADACGLGTDGSLTFDLLATPETGVPQSFNTHENNAPYFMYANRDGWTELYAQNHPAYGFYQDNGTGGNVYDLGLPKGLYKLGIRYWDIKGWGSIYPSTRKPQGNVLAYQEYWFRIQSKDGVGVGAARIADSGQQGPERRTVNDLLPNVFAQVMPNPVLNVLRLQVQGSKGQSVQTVLTDVSGRQVLRRMFVPDTNTHQEELGVSELPTGMYFLQVTSPTQHAILKVLKVK